jgi:GGDEF domain-containing protein
VTSQTALAESDAFETRESLDEALIRETAFARRHEIRLALFLFEVHGLANAGATVRAQLAAHLRAAVTTEVSLAQLSGEIVALLLRALEPAQAQSEADRLCAAIAALGVGLTATAGAATFHTARAATPEALFHAAEVALLEAKKQGLGRTVVQVDGLPTPLATPPNS